jgi:hypothetical protein
LNPKFFLRPEILACLCAFVSWWFLTDSTGFAFNFRL